MRTAAIIPLYNKESAIVRTLTSVRLQTVPVDEIIVVNDGSTDGSEKAARSVCDARIRIVTTANHGESHARNYAAAMAGDADVLLLLDADDEWHPQFVETILRLLRDFPAARAAATGYQYQRRDGRTSAPPFCVHGAPGRGAILENYFRLAVTASPLTSSSVGIYRSTFEELGGFGQQQRRGMDLAFWTTLALQAPIAFDPAVLATYHLNAENRICESVFVEERPFICGLLFEYISSDLTEADRKAELAAYYDWNVFDAARQNLIAGRPTTARRVLNSGPWIPRRRVTWLWYLLLSALPPSIFQYVYRMARARMRATAGGVPC